MIHPHTTLKMVDDTIGYGVFATEFIPRGTMTYIKDELEICIGEKRYERLSKPLQEQVEKYSYKSSSGTRIVSWDIAKYMNHCCNANSMSTGWGFEIAIRDIFPGEEITDEYGLFNMDYEFPLSCGEVNCRKVLRPDDIDRHAEQWDALVRGALAGFLEAPQPLLQHMDRPTFESLMKYLNTGKGYKSVLKLKTRRDKVSTELTASKLPS